MGVDASLIVNKGVHWYIILVHIGNWHTGKRHAHTCMDKRKSRRYSQANDSFVLMFLICSGMAMEGKEGA